DVCNPNPCLNGGQCVPNGFTGFACQCPQGFTGNRCEDRDVCNPNPCRNNGICIPTGSGSYQCQCKTGYQGVNCDQVDICGVKNPCICGTCQNDQYSAQGFRCFCPPGYSGERCEKLLNCLDNGQECMNGGECIQRPLGDYICSCPHPYCGLKCESQRPTCAIVVPYAQLSVGNCAANICNNRGICQQNGYSATCYCSTGWYAVQHWSSKRRVIEKKQPDIITNVYSKINSTSKNLKSVVGHPKVKSG
ncbi:unnamed protein product, partial [Didymodactylos carnosus]